MQQRVHGVLLTTSDNSYQRDRNPFPWTVFDRLFVGPEVEVSNASYRTETFYCFKRTHFRDIDAGHAGTVRMLYLM